jgi:hypothetical protein
VRGVPNPVRESVGGGDAAGDVVARQRIEKIYPGARVGLLLDLHFSGEADSRYASATRDDNFHTKMLLRWVRDDRPARRFRHRRCQWRHRLDHWGRLRRRQ